MFKIGKFSMWVLPNWRNRFHVKPYCPMLPESLKSGADLSFSSGGYASAYAGEIKQHRTILRFMLAMTDGSGYNK